MTRQDAGAAFLMALAVTVCLSMIAAGLALLVNLETATTGYERAALAVLHAAESGAERAIGELANVADWSGPLSGGAVATFSSGAAAPVVFGRPRPVAALTAGVQAASDAGAAWGLNNPVWRLFGHASLDDVAGRPPVASSPYVLVWVADDPAEMDDDPGADTNGVVLLQATALGAAGGRRTVEITISKAGPGVGPGSVRVVQWRERQ
jgi:hypothetical protein